MQTSCKQNCELTDAACPAVYVHIPFCRAKCRYCDFYSRGHDEARSEAFAHAALAELHAHERDLCRPLQSVFFGGGTPTVLGPRLLTKLLSAFESMIDSATEFSVEANPGTVDCDVAAVLSAHGVNRVNLGAQSFDDRELELLGRIHSSGQIASAVQTIRSAGIANLGLDLIYGLPGQTLATWQASLQQALDLGLEHLSCYALSFEPGTPLYADLQAGRLAEMDDALQKECYYAAIDAARQAGLEHYEISNFARPGRQCRHNLTYWHNESYLGIGPAAAGYVRGFRQTNVADLDAYIAAVSAGRSAAENTEHLTGRRLMGETLMLALRLMEGANLARFVERFGADPLDAFPQSLGRYQNMGAVLVDARRVRIAHEYLFVADTILADIIAEAVP